MVQRKDILIQNKITHILNVSSEPLEPFPEAFIYKHCPILDLPETDLRHYFKECFEFIESLIEDQKVVKLLKNKIEKIKLIKFFSPKVGSLQCRSFQKSFNYHRLFDA